jgi:hypothetical protein
MSLEKKIRVTGLSKLLMFVYWQLSHPASPGPPTFTSAHPESGTGLPDFSWHNIPKREYSKYSK